MLGIRLPGGHWQVDIGSPLGGGGFATVFRGVGPDGTRVAIKQFRSDRLPHAIRELAVVEWLASKSGLNFVMPVLDFGEAEGLGALYVVMPLASRSLWTAPGPSDHGL
jgi:hypothetical protein